MKILTPKTESLVPLELRATDAEIVKLSQGSPDTTTQLSFSTQGLEDVVNMPMRSRLFVLPLDIKPERYLIGLTMFGQRFMPMSGKDGCIWILVTVISMSR